MAEQWAVETADSLKRSREAFQTDLSAVRAAGADENSWGVRQLVRIVTEIDVALAEGARLYGIDPR